MKPVATKTATRVPITSSATNPRSVPTQKPTVLPPTRAKPPVAPVPATKAAVAVPRVVAPVGAKPVDARRATAPPSKTSVTLKGGSIPTKSAAAPTVPVVVPSKKNATGLFSPAVRVPVVAAEPPVMAEPEVVKDTSKIASSSIPVVVEQDPQTIDSGRASLHSAETTIVKAASPPAVISDAVVLHEKTSTAAAHVEAVVDAVGVSARQSITKGAEGLMRRDVMAIFREFDADGNGTIELSEFQDFLFALGEVHSLSQVETEFKMIDSDGSGAIDFEEFYSWFVSTDRDNNRVAAHSAVVKMKLRNRYIARKAKQVEAAIQEAARDFATSYEHPSAEMNKMHVQLSVGAEEAAKMGLLLRVTHNDGAGLEEMVDSFTKAQFAGDNVNTDDGETRERPKSAVYATFTVCDDANDLDLNEWCDMLNCLVSEAASSEEGKDGFIPAYAGFRADVSNVDGERLLIMRLFFKEDPFEGFISHLTGKADGKLSDIIQSCTFAVQCSKSIEELLSGMAMPEMHAKIEMLLEYKRHAADVSARAMHNILRRRTDDDVGDDLEDRGFEDEATPTPQGHQRAASFFPLGSSVTTDTAPTTQLPASNDFGHLGVIASLLEWLNSTHDVQLKLHFESFSRLLSMLRWLPGSQSLTTPLEWLAKGMTNAHVRRQVIRGILGDRLSGLEEHMLDFFQQAKLSIKSVNRIALQTGDALVSLDMTGISLQALWSLEQAESNGTKNVLIVGPKKAGKTALLSYLCGSDTLSTVIDEEGFVDVKTDSHALKAMEISSCVAGSGGSRICSLLAKQPTVTYDAVVLVVDGRITTKGNTLKTAVEMYEELALGGILKDKPLLVCSTRVDLKDARCSVAELQAAFPHPVFRAAEISATSGQGVGEAIAWLTSVLS